MEISLQAVKATVEKGLTALARKEATRRKMKMTEVNQKRSTQRLCLHPHLPPPENRALIRIPFPLARLEFCVFNCKLY